MDAIAQAFLKSLIFVDPVEVSALPKRDRIGLYESLTHLNHHGKSIFESITLTTHSLRLFLRDFLKKDPRPSPQNSKPNETPTRFSDEEGQMIGEVPAINRRHWSRPIQQASLDDRRFGSTEAFIPYDCETSCRGSTSETFIIFSGSLL
jgi:hypothetical protein